MPEKTEKLRPGRSSEDRAPSSVTSALLLAFTGGFLDAFLYVAHGQVFAGAMTGNVVLTGIALMGHDPHKAFHQALPVIAFSVGVWLAFALESTLKHHAAVSGLSLELAGLATAALLPASLPDAPFIIVISGLAGFQIASFRSIDEFSYNATFITGNLRSTLEGLHGTLDPDKRPEALRRLRDLGLVLVAFLAGVVAGTALTPRAGNRALWLPCGALLIVLATATRRAIEESGPS